MKLKYINQNIKGCTELIRLYESNEYTASKCPLCKMFRHITYCSTNCSNCVQFDKATSSYCADTIYFYSKFNSPHLRPRYHKALIVLLNKEKFNFIGRLFNKPITYKGKSIHKLTANDINEILNPVK